MPTKAQFESAAKLARKNIVHHGDTDIFPFPFERFVFEDESEEIVKLIVEYNENFETYLARYSPTNVSALTPVGYFGFRWATQIDYIWNAYLLSCVLVLRNEIEAARIPAAEGVVFSYRLSCDKDTGSLFDRSIGFSGFMKRSKELSNDFKYVVICDISEFYPRLGHHRLENALKQIDGSSDYPSKIMKFLSNFSRTNSFGLPIGGPAARILSEITINQVDKLLFGRGIKFVRFADDYHIFVETREDAYKSLIYLSEKLSLNQGLTLQKSKTRIMSAAEFQATMPSVDEGSPDSVGQPEDTKSDPRESILSFSLRFDPYSPNAEEEYKTLKSEIKKYDILSILKEELLKSRVHATLTRKLIKAVRYLDADTKSQAILSILSNGDVLYPIYSSVMMLIDQIIDEVSSDSRSKIKVSILNMVKSDSHILKIDIHLCYAIRILSKFNETEVISLLQQIYEGATSPIVKRDIILALARFGEWYWLSDVKNNFRQLSSPERRAFIVASYALSDEGKHWRENIKSELSPYEIVIMRWAGKKANQAGWKIGP